MIVEFDPVAKDVTINFEDERDPIAFAVDSIMFRIHGDEALYFAEASAPDFIIVGYLPVPDRDDLTVHATATEANTWQVTASTAD